MTTLKDVALIAGVSRATVSLVCRGSPLVAEKTRKKVEAAMQEAGYVYNRAAANLRSSQTNTVGLIIPDISNPVYAELLSGLEEVLDPLGKVVFVADTNELFERQSHFLQRLLEMRVDGLIISTVSGTPTSVLEPYRKENIPLVQVLRMIEGAPFDYAGINNRLGARQAADHMLQLGHRQIAFLGSLISPSVNRERYMGFCDAIEQRGFSPASMPMMTCRHTYGAAAQAAKNILAESPETTGLVCFNDIIAFGATLGLYELGLSPGHDVSVVGFDDVEAACNWRPPLTTMSIGARQLGKYAASLLAQRMEQPDLPIRTQYSEAKLQVRESTFPPRK